MDYHGQPRRSGSDPISAELTGPDEADVPVRVEDLNDGSYRLHFRPLLSGRHRLAVRLLDRPVRHSPLPLEVSAQQTPAWEARGKGFYQPFGVVLPSKGAESLFVLDTGNSRLAELDASTGALRGQFGQAAMASQGGTGIAWYRDSLWVLNWRKRSLFQVRQRKRTNFSVSYRRRKDL